MLYSKVSVLIPTRGRVERLKTLLTSYGKTTQGAEWTSELVFRVDDDDQDTQEFFLSGDALLGHHHVVIGPRYEGYRSLPFFFNEMFEYSKGDILMCGNDDMVFKTPLWAPLVIAEASKYPDGLFDIGVMTHNETHFPFSTISRKVADALGFVWDPTIFWGDIFLRDVMTWFGRCVMLPSVEIDHDWAGNRPDRVFMESDKDILRTDPNYWTETHARAVAAAVHKLEPLVC